MQERWWRKQKVQNHFQPKEEQETKTNVHPNQRQRFVQQTIGGFQQEQKSQGKMQTIVRCLPISNKKEEYHPLTEANVQLEDHRFLLACSCCVMQLLFGAASKRRQINTHAHVVR